MNEPKLFDNGEYATDDPEIIPDQFIVTEKELDREVYTQFLAELEWLDPQPDCAMLLRQGQALSSDALSLVQKKNVLAQLAIRGTAEAYQLLQQYDTCPDPALEQWSRIALYECRMRLEEEMLDVPVGLISTGLGGNGERLRYIFVLAWQGEAQAEDKHREIREALDRVCRKHHSRAEQVQFRPSCLYVQVLVPLDVAIGEVIEESIARLNQQDEQVWPDYMATNVSVPSEEEIKSFLEGLQ